MDRRHLAWLALGAGIGLGCGLGVATLSKAIAVKRVDVAGVVGNPWRDHRRFMGTVTFYGAGLRSTGKRPGDRFYGYTHSGLPVGLGLAAADPHYYPPGTLLRVRDRYYLVADTGVAVQGPTRFDLYVRDDEVADVAGARLEWVEVVR